MNTKFGCKLTVMVFVILVLLPACAPVAAPAATPTTDPLLSMVQGYVTSFNAHDLDGTMALLTDNVSYVESQWGYNLNTKPNLQNTFDFYFGQNADIQADNCKVVSGVDVSCQGTFTIDCSRAAGIQDYHGEWFFATTGGKISQITWWHDDQDDYQKYNHFNTQWLNWLQENYKSDYDAINSNSGPSGHELGARVSAECSEFAKTLK